MRPSAPHHRSALLLALAGLAGVGLAAAALAAATPGTARAALGPPAEPGALVAAAAAAVGWVLVARLAVGLAATAVAVSLRGMPGRTARLAARCAEAFTPVLLHGLLRAALGAVSVGATAALAPALVPAVALADPGLPVLPVLDRVPGVVAADPAPVRVVVRPGDSLWRITAAQLPSGAGAAEVAAAWPDWYAANRATIGADPGRLRPGQVLVAPAGWRGSR